MSHQDDVTMEEITLQGSEGLTIAGQRWTRNDSRSRSGVVVGYGGGSGGTVAATVPSTSSSSLSSPSPAIPKTRILCFHGFLDNCRTYYQLAPFLVSRMENVELVALDYPGHGLSSHKSLDSPPMVVHELCFDMRDACRSLGWDDDRGFLLIGHSLGAIVALLYASTFPEQVKQLVLLDGYGPESYEMFQTYVDEMRQKLKVPTKATGAAAAKRKPKGMVAERIQRHVRQRFKSNIRTNTNNNINNNNNSNQKTKKKRTYSSIHAAVKTRMRTAELSPGRQWISMAAALELVRRAVVFDQYPRVRFIHDPRFNIAPLQLNTLEHVDVYWRHIACPTLWLRAMDGWPFPSEFVERAEAILLGNKLGTIQYLPGSHHFHADPATAEDVGLAVFEFLLPAPPPGQGKHG